MPPSIVWAKAGGVGSHEKVRSKRQGRCLLSVCRRFRLDSPMLSTIVVLEVAKEID